MTIVQEALDDAIAGVSAARVRRLCRSLSGQQAAERITGALESLRGLQRNERPCYDEWEAPFYLSWYQPRQIHLVYALLRQRFGGGIRGPLAVIDVGCGAWAVQIAVAILAAEAREDRGDGAIAVAGVDPSLAMRNIGCEVWRALRASAARRGLPRLVETMEKMEELSGTFSLVEECRLSGWLLEKLVQRTLLGGRRRQRGPSSPRGTREAGQKPACWLTCVHAVYADSVADVDGALSDGREELRLLGMAPDLLLTSDESKRGLIERVAPYGRSACAVPVWRGRAGRTTDWRRALAREVQGLESVRSLLERDVLWSSPHNPIEKDAVRIQ